MRPQALERQLTAHERAAELTQRRQNTAQDLFPDDGINSLVSVTFTLLIDHVL